MFLINDLTSKKFKLLVKKLSQMKGRHTELVSVYVPSGYNINEMKTLIANEQGTAVNIKSKSTRKNVMTALERVGQKLKQYNQTPKNGLIIFCGNVSEREGIPDINMWELEPPEPISMRLYRCDQTFIVEPLQDMTREKEIYGMVTLDTQDAAIAVLRGKKIDLKKHLTSLVPGKTGKGGQSAARFGRVRQGLILTFKKDIGVLATKTFEEEKDLIGIIIGGPGPLKEDFAEGDYLSEAMKKKILGVKDIGYAGVDGLRELLLRSQDVLSQSGVVREKKILGRFFELLRKETGLASYGYIEVKKALEKGAVDTLILSEQVPLNFFEIKCNSCDYTDQKISSKKLSKMPCPKCSANTTITESDFFDAMENIAEQTSTKFEIVSSETQEGAQFLQLGGIGAILRYKLE
ncbi:peptide chain release factor 1 [archaeon]|nr:peptide chain release factor 1 [archaeon]